jgi:two-component system LytT family response regulator
MLRALIVDDEPAARSELRYLLEAAGNIRVIGEASNAEEAFELISQVPYDVIFLDIRMPGLSGTELARKLSQPKERPFIVFVTAYSEHAVEAFEVDADDYLVKPVSEERLQKTIEKIQRKHEGRTKEPASRDTRLEKIDRIFVDYKDRKIPINISDINFFEAVDDYSRIYTETGSFLISYSLRFLEDRLSSAGFLRVHRKYLVNTVKIKEIIQLSRNAYILRVGDSRMVEIPVSRRKISTLKRVLEL